MSLLPLMSSVTMSPSRSLPWSLNLHFSTRAAPLVPFNGYQLPYCSPYRMPCPHASRSCVPSGPHSVPPLVAGPPSAPRDLQYSLSRSPLALRLRWLPPADSGGRSDVTYSLLCLRCGRDGPAGACQPCGPRVAFVPRQAGLRERAATLLHLRPGARYTVRVAALNGVSGPAAAAGATYAQVTVSTGPGGKATRPNGDRPSPTAAVSRMHFKAFRSPRDRTPFPPYPTPDPGGDCVSHPPPSRHPFEEARMQAGSARATELSRYPFLSLQRKG